jgi:hypothetical protein
MMEKNVAIPLELLREVEEEARALRKDTLGMLPTSLERLLELVPPEIPNYAVGTMFTAQWKSGKKLRVRFWVYKPGRIVSDDLDDSGWEYVDIRSIKDVQTPISTLEEW